MFRPRAYQSFADFQRDEIRPGMRAGWSLDELEEPALGGDLDFDADPFEAMLDAVDDEDEDDDD